MQRHDEALQWLNLKIIIIVFFYSYDKALIINKDIPQTWCNKGKLLKILKNYEGSISWLIKIILLLIYFLVKIKLLHALNPGINIDCHIID